MNRVDEYLESHTLQTHDAVEIIEEFSDEIGEMHGKCIDIGCGPATVTRRVFMPMLPSDASIVGVDKSKSMIDFAKDNHKDEKRLSFFKLNLETSVLPHDHINAYENAVSFYCMHWCRDLEKACKNIYDLLRPGGHALLVFLARSLLFDTFVTMHENPLYKPYMEDVSKFLPYYQTVKSPRASFKRMLKDTGFEVIHCSLRQKYFPFTIEGLRKHIAPLDPFIDRMPADVMENYREDMFNVYLTKAVLVANTDNGSVNEHTVLDKYKLMIAYIAKPKS